MPAAHQSPAGDANPLSPAFHYRHTNMTRPLFNGHANTYISRAGLRFGYGDKRSV